MQKYFKFDALKVYGAQLKMVDEIEDAVKKAMESPERKFKESVDLVINLRNIDMAQPQNRISEDIILPNGHGKQIKVCVFADGENALKARDKADMVITSEDLEKLGKDKKRIRALAKDYDFFVAEAPMMPTIGKQFGSILAPRGKMPDPIPLGADITPAMDRVQNLVRIRSKDKTTFHVRVGKKTMPASEIAENIQAIINRIESKLENGKHNIASIYVKTTMGPRVKVV